MDNQASNQRPEFPFNRTESINVDLRNFHLEQDAQQHHPSWRTAMPPVGVRLTLRITLIPTPTGWTVSLASIFRTSQRFLLHLHQRQFNTAQCSVEGTELPAHRYGPADLASRTAKLAARLSAREGSRLRQTAPIPVPPEWINLQTASGDSGTFVL